MIAFSLPDWRSSISGILLTVVAIPGVSPEAQEVSCMAGFAGPYPCQNVDLKAFLPTNALIGGTGSDIWGWTDPLTGKEYAIQGHGAAVPTSTNSATTFTDISDPENPIYLGFLPAPAINLLWRDVKVYQNHAYIVGDANVDTDHGVEIFDLTQLRGLNGTPPVMFAATSVYHGTATQNVGNAHNIWINEESGFLYVVASSSCGGGMHVANLALDPANPQFVSCIDTIGLSGQPLNVHDAQCVVYRGPDSEHFGKEICFNANEDELHVVDVNDKSSPVVLAKRVYEGLGYVHQGTLTEDHAYFLSNDELDELNALTAAAPHNTHTYLWDIRDLDNPVQMPTFVGSSAAIDHNMYVRGQYLFQTNYTAGLRIIDIFDVANANLSEIAFFDTHPADNATTFAGTWSNYAFFPSGTVVASNIEDGLYVLEPNLPADLDGDYVADANDNCIEVSNPTQCDTNGDGFGNHCDADLDNNGIVNQIDLGMLRAQFGDTGESDADLDCNRVVNQIDLGMLRDAFGEAPGPSGRMAN